MFNRTKKDTESGTLLDARIYNPPPNAYNTVSAFEQHKTILTGSLYGPKIPDSQLGSFGTAQRFTAHKNSIPGPGEYDTNNKQTYTNNTVHSKLSPLKWHKEIIKNTLKQSVSIPKARNDVGTKLEKELGTYRAVQETVEPQDKAKLIKPASIGHKFGKDSYKERFDIPNGRSAYQDDNVPLIEQQQQNGYPPVYEQASQEAIVYEKDQKQIDLMRAENQRRKEELFEMINKSISQPPSLELIQLRNRFINKDVPGPGRYAPESVKLSQPEDIRSSVFASKTTRMAEDSARRWDLGPGQYDPISNTQTAKGFSFDRSKRTLFNQEKKEVYQFIPSAEQDRPRIQRNFSNNSMKFGSAFGSGTSRFSETASSQTRLTNNSAVSVGRSCGRNKSSISSSAIKNTQSILKQIRAKQGRSMGLSTALSTEESVWSSNNNNTSTLSNIKTLCALYAGDGNIF